MNVPSIMRSARFWVTFAAICLLWARPAAALPVPALEGRVNDFAGLISAAAEKRLDLLLRDLEEKDSTQIVVVAIPSLEGDALEPFSMRLAEQWRIGHKGRDNGAILLIARKERQVRIEVGYGLEGRLTDLQAGRIIRHIIAPQFKSGRFDEGIVDGVTAMIDAVRGEFRAEERSASGKGDPFPVDPVAVLLFAGFLVVRIGRENRWLGAAAGGVLAPLLGFMVFAPGILTLAALAAAGFIVGLILAAVSGMVPVGGVIPRRGGFKGGFGGGGFSSGGFSGGGGGFGGGGASGRW